MADFPKKMRLLTKADFNQVFNKSVKVSNSLFLILIHKNSKSHARLGLVISKKVDKRAVVRNRIKRLVRESFRNYEFSQNCDFVVLARAKAKEHKNQALLANLNNLWSQAENKIKQISQSRKKK